MFISPRSLLFEAPDYILALSPQAGKKDPPYGESLQGMAVWA
jgi:hypothetical protein